MDSVTQTIVNYIEQTDVSNREDLLSVARIAFLDYLASLAPAEEEQAVRDLAQFIGADQNLTVNQDTSTNQDKTAHVDGYESNSTVRRADKALYYGFASHYLDFDDAQANLAGHFSTVLYSALLAVLEPTDTWHDFLRAYIIGAELEGIIGSLINPVHRTQGWHSTGTVGVIGAAAAIGALRGLHGESLAQLLSLAATQSAAICGAEAAEIVAHSIYTTSSSYVSKHYNVSPDAEEQGKRRLCATLVSSLWDDIDRVTVHFPPGADAALRYTSPTTGREGQFSIEYVVYQVLAYGAVQDELFKIDTIDHEVRDYMSRIERVYDLPKVAQTERITKVTVTLKNGDTFTETVNNPKGSPNNPLNLEDIRIKLGLTLKADQIDRMIEAFTHTNEVEPFLQILRKEGVLYV